MSQIIAGIYEIHEKIGAGGGGIVYLGRHLRLEKWVILKADKRTLKTEAESLRREVDLLKGLSHTYIPQVYDFVQEDGIVYTVMDFIEGESLDKILKRNQIPPQFQVIQWACQLLEALAYLHSRPPYGILHGDIKPANIMLRPNGDICLIDYNIALALGEDGAVKVGYSLGYASPEHYGSVDVEDNKPYSDGNTVKIKTIIPSADGISSGASPGRSSGRRQGMMLDVRSDLYSLGATLYHLLCGKRPSKEASQVEPLGADVCSPAVSAIIQKAMAPKPDMRYQTATEMLTAFHQLHKKDIRVIRHKRRMAGWAAGLSILFLAGGASTLIGMKRLERTKECLALAEYSANYLAEGDISGAVSLALQALTERKSMLEPPVPPQVQKALTDALGVYDLSDGFKSADIVELPSAPFAVRESPEGTRFAVVYPYETAVFDMGSGEKIAEFPMVESALADVAFADESRIVYAGQQGVTAYDLDTGKTLWTGQAATTVAVSGDGSVAACVNRDEDHAVLYRMSDGTELMECSFEGQHMETAANDIFANPHNRIFSLSEKGEFLAVSFAGGGLWIFDLEHPDDNMILYDETNYSHFEGGFCGRYFAFAANKSDESMFGLIDTGEGFCIGSLESRDNFHLKADRKGMYLANGNLLVRLDPDTLEETELAYTNDADITGFSVGESYVLTATDDNGFSIYDRGAVRLSSEICQEACDFVVMTDDYAVLANRNEPSVRLLKKESHEDGKLMAYDARCIHDEARISQDGRTVMLFDYEAFHIYDGKGQAVADRKSVV